MRRASLLVGLCLAALLAGCGFALRGSPNFAFQSLYIVAPEKSALAAELRRGLAGNAKLQVISDASKVDNAQVVLEILSDQRAKVVTGLTPVGQVTDFQLRLQVKFRLRTAQGKELIAETELAQKRELSFSESAALAKEVEEGLLYRDMQSDIVQQMLRRLASIKAL